MNQTIQIEAAPLHISMASLQLSAVAEFQRVSTALTINKVDVVASTPSGRPEITLREVSMHACASDCWLVIYDRVYDVTAFLDLHPGGHDVMLEYAGRDASFAFRSTGHSQYAINALSAYEIGELPVSERIFRCAGKLRMHDLPK